MANVCHLHEAYWTAKYIKMIKMWEKGNLWIKRDKLVLFVFGLRNCWDVSESLDQGAGSDMVDRAIQPSNYVSHPLTTWKLCFVSGVHCGTQDYYGLHPRHSVLLDWEAPCPTIGVPALSHLMRLTCPIRHQGQELFFLALSTREVSGNVALLSICEYRVTMFVIGDHTH